MRTALLIVTLIGPIIALGKSIRAATVPPCLRKQCLPNLRGEDEGE